MRQPTVQPQEREQAPKTLFTEHIPSARLQVTTYQLFIARASALTSSKKAESKKGGYFRYLSMDILDMYDSAAHLGDEENMETSGFCLSTGG